MVLSSPVSMETDGESFIFQNRPSDRTQTVSQEGKNKATLKCFCFCWFVVDHNPIQCDGSAHSLHRQERERKKGEKNGTFVTNCFTALSYIWKGGVKDIFVKKFSIQDLLLILPSFRIPDKSKIIQTCSRLKGLKR